MCLFDSGKRFFYKSAAGIVSDSPCFVGKLKTLRPTLAGRPASVFPHQCQQPGHDKSPSARCALGLLLKRSVITSGRKTSNDGGDLPAGPFLCHRADAVVIRDADIDPHILPVDIADLGKPLPKDAKFCTGRFASQLSYYLLRWRSQVST